MTISLPDFKKGDSFTVNCTYLQNGVPYDITNIDIKSQIREAAVLVTDLVITKADQTNNPGVFILTPSNSDTSTWPSGNLLCDIQFTEQGIVRSTETFYVSLIEQVTL